MAYREEALNRELFKIFTSNEKYLSILSTDKGRYIGKSIPTPLSFDELMVQKVHIASVLKRLFPKLIFSNDDFHLITQVNRQILES